jgi:hypothetical protein
VLSVCFLVNPEHVEHGRAALEPVHADDPISRQCLHRPGNRVASQVQFVGYCLLGDRPAAVSIGVILEALPHQPLGWRALATHGVEDAGYAQGTVPLDSAEGPCKLSEVTRLFRADPSAD